MTADEAPQPGELLGSGRAADVYDLGNGRVLRRYREPSDTIDDERRTMQFVADNGIRVPKLYDGADGVADFDPTRDIVMERIDGITLLDDFAERPWKLISHIRLLARLQSEINALDAPDWMITPSTTSASEPSPREAPTGSVLHLELHPLNVLLSEAGPVVIDWTNAAGGPAGFDAAMTYVQMATFEVEGFVQRLGARFGVELFKRASGAAEIDAFLVAACDHRLADTGPTPDERRAIAALRNRALGKGE